MTAYESTLILGIVLIVWGILRFFRQLVGGEVGLISVLLMSFGGVALVVADNYSPKGLQVEDIMPAFMHFITVVRRAVL